MTAPVFTQPPVPGAWAMVRALVGVGLVCGLLIVSAFLFTEPIIARNRAAALERAIFAVLPAARTSRAFALAGDGRLVPAETAAPAAPVVHAAYDERGALAGVAIAARGLGYQDVIEVLYGYDPAREAIVGLEVLSLRDTPGLGDKIESDPQFLRNFEHLDVRLAAGGAALANPIVPVKPGEKEQPWEVDTITGATITSSAVARMLDESAAFWVPRLRPQLAALRRAE